MPEAQRRLAAVMFTDIVGFTATSQRDEALAMRLLEEHRAILRPLFIQHDGHEVKTIGDAFLVEFESALDAARCAVDAQRILHERNTQVAGEPIELRIGLHVGDVIHQENDVYGDAVNVASRIHGYAEPGGICLSEAVAAQLRGKLGLTLEKLPPTQLKNVTQPIELYRIGLPWTEGGVVLTTPWVDRDAELAVAHRHLTRALRGEGGTLFVSGEAGIGKSRMMDDTAEAAVRGGGRVLRGRCGQGELSAPYAPWVEAIRELMREAPAQLLYKILGTHAAEVARLVPEISEKVGPAPPAPGGDPERALLKLLEAVAGLFSKLAAESPVVLVLDDLQWADSASVTLLLFLARHVRGRPILIIGAYRDDGADENEGLNLAISELNRERLADVVTLGRFDTHRTGELISRTFHEPETSVEFAELIHERTGGNPFFIEEVLRALVRDGTIHWTSTGWERKPVKEIELPKALKEAMVGRLRRVDDSTVDLLRWASVVGYEFEFELLKAVSGLEEARLLDLLESALKSGLVRETERPGRRLVYLFADHQIRDVVYGDISLVRRRRLHLKVAQAMGASREAETREKLGALAFHFLQGNDSAKALTYSVRAAENASALFARAESIQHYRTALELAEDADDLERKASILMGLGQAEELFGQAQSAVEHYRAAASLYDALGQRRPRGEALTNAGSAILEHLGDLRLALKLLREAVGILEPEGESRELAIGYVNLGYLCVQNEELAEARRMLEAGLPLTVTFGLANERSIALQFLALTAPLEAIPQALAQLREAAEIAQAADALRASTKWSNLAQHLVRLESDFTGAWEASEQGVREGVRREAPYFIRYARTMQLLILDLRGDWAQAYKVAESLLEQTTKEPSVLVNLAVARELARLEFRRGNRNEGLRHAHRALEMAERVGEVGERTVIEEVLAWDLVERGAISEARERLRASWKKIHARGVAVNNLWESVGILSTLVATEVADNRSEEASRSAAELEELAARANLPWVNAALGMAQAKISRSRGDHARSEQLFRQSAEVSTRLGMPYEAAVATAEQGEELGVLGRPDDARQELQKAVAIFERLEARPWLERLRSRISVVAPVVEPKRPVDERA